MRLLALTSLILASTLATGAFAAPAESLNYNVVNLSAEASREISNDEMHAVLYIAVGRVNFSSRSADIVRGLASDKVHQVLGEARSLEMIHRNHMAIY
jgi:predicted secreted protein